MKKLAKNEKLLTYLVLVAVVAILIWFTVISKYTGVNELPDDDVISPTANEGIEVRNTVKTTVSVVAPPEGEVTE